MVHGSRHLGTKAPTPSLPPLPVLYITIIIMIICMYRPRIQSAFQVLATYIVGTCYHPQPRSSGVWRWSFWRCCPQRSSQKLQCCWLVIVTVTKRHPFIISTATIGAGKAHESRLMYSMIRDVDNSFLILVIIFASHQCCTQNNDQQI